MTLTLLKPSNRFKRRYHGNGRVVSFTDHALERCEQRSVDEEQLALDLCSLPEAAVCRTVYARFRVWTGRCVAVVQRNPVGLTVVTVID